MFRLRLSHLLQYRDLLCNGSECRRQHARRRHHYGGRKPREAAPPATASARHPAATFTANRDFNADTGATFSGSMTFSGSIAFGQIKLRGLPGVPKSA
jgi:hypothetical protein